MQSSVPGISGERQCSEQASGRSWSALVELGKPRITGLVMVTMLCGALVAPGPRPLGRLLIAMRAKEERVRFTGYDTANLKVFVFVFAAVVSGIGGALFTLIVGFMSPSFVGIVPSIEMVIATAVGGRQSLLGAIYGSLLVNYGKTFFSESLPELWLFLLGGLFILVVMAFPNGLAGLNLRPWLDKGRLFKLRARWRALETVTAAPSQPQHEVPR